RDVWYWAVRPRPADLSPSEPGVCRQDRPAPVTKGLAGWTGRSRPRNLSESGQSFGQPTKHLISPWPRPHVLARLFPADWSSTAGPRGGRTRAPRDSIG